MTLEDICVSLDLAKQLKEAGYPQESLFYWVKHNENDGKQFGELFDDFVLLPFDQGIDSDDEGRVWTVKHEAMKNDPEFWECYAAPTASEIGDKLPHGFQTWHYWKTSNEYVCGVSPDDIDKYGEDEWGNPFSVEADTEANARAKMWLYLKKEGLL